MAYKSNIGSSVTWECQTDFLSSNPPKVYFYPTYATDPIAYCLQLWGADFQTLITDNLYCRDECYLDQDETETERDADCLACFTEDAIIAQVKQDYKDTILVDQDWGHMLNILTDCSFLII